MQLTSHHADQLIDYIFAMLRKELSLPFDVNDGFRVTRSYDTALLTDGSTMLCIFVTRDAPKYDAKEYVCTVDGKALYCVWDVPPISSRTLLDTNIAEVIRRGIAAFRQTLEDYAGVISLAIHGTFLPLQIAEWFAQTIPGALIREVPQFQGKMIDGQELKFESNPHEVYLQVAFRPPRSLDAIRKLLGKCLEGIDVGHLEKNKRYVAKGAWQSYGVESSNVIIRRF